MKGILIDHDTGDLLVKDGSLVLGDTSGQIAESVLNSMRGEWKEFPLIGGEVRKMLGGTPDPMWRGRVKKMLQSCGLDVQRITIENDTITLY